MHPGILSALIVTLVGNFLGAAAAHTTGPAYRLNDQKVAALYSILAQAATPTTSTEITPTAIVTGTLQAGATVTITSTAVVTGETTITATATTTNTAPLSTPIPLPTTVPQSNLQINPFDWGFLTSWPTEPKVGPFAIAFLVLMMALIAAGIYFLRVRRPQWKGTNPVLYKAVNRFVPYVLWIGGLGILFLILRIFPLDFFNLRLWLYLDFLALLALAGWILNWYRTSYPKELEKFQKTQKARQYMPGGSGKLASRSTPVANPSARGSQAKQPAPKTPPARPGGTGTGTGTGTPTSGAKPAQQGTNKNRRKK